MARLNFIIQGKPPAWHVKIRFIHLYLAVKRASAESGRIMARSRALLKAGEPIRALRCIQPLLDLREFEAVMTGVDILSALGLMDKAALLLEDINQGSGHIQYALRSAKLMAAKGDSEGALALLETVVHQHLDEPNVANTYLQVLDAAHRHKKAVAVCEELLAAAFLPAAGIYRWMALFLWRQGSRPQSYELYNKAIKLNPADPEAYYQIGMLLKESGDLLGCSTAWMAGLLQAKRHAAINYELGALSEDVGENHHALRFFTTAWHSHPCFELMNGALFTVPLVFAYDRQETALARKRFLRGLSRAKHLTKDHFFVSGYYGSRMKAWSLGYQEGSMKRIMEEYSSCIVRCLPESVARTSRPQVGRDQSPQSCGRIRIAMVSEYFYNHSNQRVFEGLAKFLNRDKFFLVIVHGPASVSDAVRERMNSYADEVIYLSQNIAESADLLAASPIDIVLYSDLGMSLWMHAFASLRHAPVQATTWGVPYTSGLPSIDYYVSSGLAEPRGSQKHYTEKLHLLSRLPACYLSENIPEPSHERPYFFLPEDKFVFGTLQNVAKYHPDFDAILEEIAQRAPESVFVFVEHAGNNLVSMKLLDRWSSSAPSMFERIHFVASMSRDEFVSLSNCVDLLLDPPYFGSGVSFYESISTGTPVVSLRGKHLRSRFVSAAYQMMGIAKPPVALTPSEYIKISLDLYQNRAKLWALKAEIKVKSACLFDDLEMVGECEEFFVEAIREYHRPNCLGGD